MSLDLDAILKRLRDGESPEAIAASGLPEAQRELLRRCAVPRRFDRALVDAVLRPFDYLVSSPYATSIPVRGQGRGRRVGPVAEGDAAWEVLVGGPPAEALPGVEGWHRIRASDRAEWLRSWDGSYSETTAARELHRRLRAYWADRGEPLEALHHGAVADPMAMQDEFEAAFDAAEAAFDLPRCADLLAAYAGGAARLARPARSVAERRARLEALGLWAEERYRTARFVERPELAAALDRVLGPSPAGPWALQLHAAGGMGKTQFLRWALARRCVPAGVPCARLDFDVANAQALVDRPDRLALALAEPLNRQVAGAPLLELLGALGRDAAGADPLGRLAAALRETLPPGTPALVVLDTLEEVLLPRPGVLVALLRKMVALHGIFPNLRLLLAGRYDLRAPDRLGADCPIPTAESIDLPVPPFTAAESLDYLGRHVADVAADVQATAVRLAGGNPLRLALYAEILATEPEMTAQRLEAEGSVDLVYLIRRIVLRLRFPDRTPDHVLAFVLRYGAVPRVLTEEFLRRVIVPRLPEAMARDDPEAGLTAALRETKPFVPTEPGAIDVADLWRRLTTYAGGSSWVRVGQAPGGAAALVLQTEVVNPMRRLLRQRPAVADLLHDAALAYYRAAADADPTQRILLTCEATYHDFQRHGAAAGGRWRAAIDAPALRRDPAARLALAEEVTGTAYVDDDGEPREWGVGQPLIDPADLAYAHAHRARAHLDLTRRESGDAEWHWKEVGGALGHHDRLAGRHPGATAPPATLAPVRAAGLAHRGDTGGALDALAPASEALDLADLIAGWRMRGDLLRDQVRPDLAGAADSYRTALELMARAPERFLPADRFEIREFLARVELDRDRMAEALAACPDSIEVARFLPNDRIGQSELLTGGELARNRMAEGSWVDPALGVRLVLLRRTILLRSGRPQRALSEPIPEAIGFLARLGDWNGADAEAELDLLNFREAQYHLEPFFRDPESARSRMGPETAMAFDIDSRIAFSLFQFHRAIHRLAEAHRQWAEMRRYDYANRALARLVAARLHDLGDLGAARAELGEWSSDTQDDSPGEADIELEMLRAECLDRGGAGDEARRLVERRLAQARSSGPPRMIVRVALQGLLLREGSIDAFLDALGEALHAITPRSARAARLEPLQRCTRSEAFDAGLVARFLEALGSEPDAELTPRERGLWSLRAAEAFRIVGQVDDAARLLDAATAELLPANGTAFPLFALLRGLDRLGRHDRALKLAAEHLGRFLDEFQEYHFLRATVLLDQADRALTAGDLAAAERAVPAAEPDVVRAGVPGGHLPKARLHAARARLAAARGMSDEAVRQRELALSLYRELGDLDQSVPLTYTAQASGGLGLSGSSTPTLTVHPAIPKTEGHFSPSPLFPVPPAYTLVLYDRKGTEFLAETIPPEHDVAAPGIVRKVADTRKLFNDMEESAYLAYVAQEYGAHGNGRPWQPLGAALADAVLGPMPIGARATDSGPFDLRIEAADAELASHFWELMVVADEVITATRGVRHLYRHTQIPNAAAEAAAIRHLQHNLRARVAPDLDIDGRDGPSLRAALRTFQGAEGLDPTGVADAATRDALDRATRPDGPRSVFILHSFQDSLIASSRGVEIAAGSLRSLYEAAGFAVEVQEHSSRPLAQFRDRVPAVLHVAARLDFDPSLGVHVLVGAEGSLRLTPTDLGRWIHEWPPGSAAPLVVLDPRQAPSLSETLRQLRYRNAFAARLANLGPGPAVLATGLGRLALDQPRQMEDALIAAISGGRTLGAIAAILRRQAPPGATSLEEVLGPLATALFCRDPEERAPGSGLTAGG